MEKRGRRRGRGGRLGPPPEILTSYSDSSSDEDHFDVSLAIYLARFYFLVLRAVMVRENKLRDIVLYHLVTNFITWTFSI